MILYPFHPRAGQMVQVEHRKRFAGEDHLVVLQPDVAPPGGYTNYKRVQ